jgi:hypothetical protein
MFPMPFSLDHKRRELRKKFGCINIARANVWTIDRITNTQAYINIARAHVWTIVRITNTEAYIHV